VLGQKGKEGLQHSELENHGYPNIRLEYGFHVYGKLPFLENKAYPWNDGIDIRIGRYNPDLVTIDGIVPGGLSSLEISTIKNGQPGPLRLITNKTEVFFVRGDLGMYSNILLPVFQFQSLLSEFQKKRHTEIISSLDQVHRNHVDFSDWTRVGRYASPLALAILAALTSKKVVESPPLSRRKFLQGTVKAVGGAITASEATIFIGRISCMLSSAFVINEETNKLIKEIAGLFGPWKKEDWWCDGRTGILIAKTFDAIDHLHLPNTISGTILMGNGHLPRGQKILTGQVERDKAVALFAKRVISSCTQVFEKYQLPPQLINFGKRCLLDSITQTDVVKVSRHPTGVIVDPSENEEFSICSRFSSPRVNNALLELRGSDGFRF